MARESQPVPKKNKESAKEKEKKLRERRAKLFKTEEMLEAANHLDGMGLFDMLIHNLCVGVINGLNEKFKVGDLTGMIELRYKLAPTKAEKSKFWEMMADIRRHVEEEKKAGAGQDGAQNNSETPTGDVSNEVIKTTEPGVTGAEVNVRANVNESPNANANMKENANGEAQANMNENTNANAKVEADANVNVIVTSKGEEKESAQ